MDQTSSQSEFEVIVIGVGAMGSATLYELARRGVRVLGIEQFDAPNTMGSSHGRSRIIRLAYYEHPFYVNLLRRAYELWRRLERDSGERLLTVTGSIDASREDNWVFRGSLESCVLHDLPHEVLTPSQVAQRFPAYRLPSDMMALYQPDGGYLRPEACISAFVSAAQVAGATTHIGETVTDVDHDGCRFTVVTNRARYNAARVVVTAGPWIDCFVPSLRGVAVPERQVLGWFEPAKPDWFMPDRLPVFNMEVEEGRYYGLPIVDEPGFKIGRYRHRHEIVDPATMNRDVHPEDEQVLRQCVERYFPAGSGRVLSMQTCLFTNTSDGHFVIGGQNDEADILYASSCSGHGFKFASVVGEILADLATQGRSRHDISLFDPARFDDNATAAGV